MSEYPSPELVVESFYRTVHSQHGVTTNLPPITVPDATGRPKNNWGDKKFWITPVSYGVGRRHNVPMRSVIVRVDVWGKPVDKPRHWGRTINLGQELVSYTTDWYTNLTLGMPYPGYHPVEISSMDYISDTRRVQNDPQGLARVQFDLEVNYKILVGTAPPEPDPEPEPGGDANVTYPRLTPSTVWSVTHNLGYYPHVQLFDEAWNEIEGSLHHLNTNTFIVEWNTAQAGYVVVG